MNLPTKLTIARIPATFVIMALLFAPGWLPKLLALACFIAAGLTDWLDGYLARRWGLMSPLGALLDPIADKVLVLGLFLAFVQLRVAPAWMVLVIMLRELVITGVRLFAASRGIVLAAAKEGKHKTVSQIMTIGVVLIALLAQELAPYDPRLARLDPLWPWAILLCLWTTLLLTVISGAGFFRRHWTLLRDAATRSPG